MKNGEKTVSIQHKKYRNTAILFELLTRKLTVDIINGIEDSVAQTLLEKYFKRNGELGKEYILYQALFKTKYSNKDMAIDFLNEIIEAHKNLKHGLISKSKYSLLNEIKNSFDETEFYKPKIEDYKVLASIYKIFKSKSLKENISPEDITNSKYTIISHIMESNKEIKNADDIEEDEALTEYNEQDADLRLLTYKLLIEKFNQKYTNKLNTKQVQIIREYINNISNVNSLNTYIKSEIPVICDELQEKINGIDDKVTQIKINEVCNQLEKIKDMRNYTDNHIMAILNSYELLKEIDSLNDDGEN